MKQLNLLVCILLAITLLSCDSSINRPKVYYDFSWECTNIPCSYTHSVAVGNNGDVWASGFDSEELSYVSHIICLSTDNGNTWVQKFTFPSAGSIAINPTNGYVFVIDPHRAGLFRSTDRGESWVKVTSTSIHIYDILITPSGEIYLGVMDESFSYIIQNPHKGVYYSSDNGDTWIQRRNGLPDEDIRSLALSPDGTLYAGTFNFGVYRSIDGGNTWLPPSNYTNVVISSLTVSNDGSIFATASPFNNRLVSIPPPPPSGPPIGVLKSTDRGVTWYQVNTGLNIDEWISSVMYNPITNEIFVNNGFL